MKKAIIFLLIIICISLQITGCTKQKIDDITKENQKIETTIKKTGSDIREIAYQSLNENEKKKVIDWKGASVEEYKSTTDLSAVSQKGDWINLKGKDTYRITFTTNNAMFGPILVFVEKNTFNVFSGGLHD